MINHMPDRLRGYLAERDLELEDIIEEVLTREGTSFLELPELVNLLATQIRQWNKGGGRLFKEDEDLFSHDRPAGEE